MRTNETNIDDLFKDELGSYTETPPPAAWEALENRLRAPQGPRLAYRRLGYLSLLLLIGGISFSVVKALSGGTATDALPIAANEKSIATLQDAAPVTGNNTTTQTTIANQTTNINQTTQPGTPSLLANHKTTPVKHTTTTNRNTAPVNKYQTPSKQAQPYTAPVYNSAAAGPAADKDDATVNINSAAPVTQSPKLPAEVKKDLPKTAAVAAAPPVEPAKHAARPSFNRFEAGIKAGYEKSFSNLGATKGVFSPYLQYNLSPKWAIMTQPSVKYANVNITKIGSGNSYYKENADSTSIGGGSTPTYLPGSAKPVFWITNYTYTQTHDSIVKSYTNGGTYMEFEFPILAKYNITKGFSVYSGVNITYSQLTGIKENTYQSKNIAITKSNVPSVSADSGQAIPKATSSVITYSGTPITNYTGPLYSSPQGGLIRYGYMAGFSYEYSGHWLFDALIQQTPTKTNMQAGYNINVPLSSPYFRLTIGYKLTK